MNADYERHAYARVILYELRQYLLDRFVSTEEPAKAAIICEEVLYADRQVSQQALHDMLNRLARMEEQERLRMTEFEMRRRRLPKETKEEVDEANKAEPSPQGSNE